MITSEVSANKAISIHAPARGATLSGATRPRISRKFQSTLPRGERRVSEDVHSPHKNDFNPRSREGSDEIKESGLKLKDDFNPRSREGSDSEGEGYRYTRRISIHAPARGATYHVQPDDRFFLISIHAPARGATPECRNSNSIGIISIHAPARGATQ